VDAALKMDDARIAAAAKTQGGEKVAQYYYHHHHHHHPSDEAEMMGPILQSWTKRATLPKLLQLRSPGIRLTPTC
jgi:hypothetical protein